MKISHKKAQQLQKRGIFKTPQLEMLLKRCYFQIRWEATMGHSFCSIPRHSDYSLKLIREAVKTLQKEGYSAQEHKGKILISWA